MTRTTEQYYPISIFLGILLIMFGMAMLLKREDEVILAELPLVEVPELIVVEDPIPDFASMLDVQEKKDTFFSFLGPYVAAVNQQILAQRQRLLVLQNKADNEQPLTRAEMAFLTELRVDYELENERLNTLNLINRLLKRADIIPQSLALAQAANESAWGTSRFAQQGNNFFGQWCYTEGCGIVPSSRVAGASHEVKSFESVLESVRSYIMNLNTFPSYQHLRDIRLELREEGQPLDGITLSEGLDSYSERGDEYIFELQSMIYSNNLLEHDRAEV
jgi:Bax protein